MNARLVLSAVAILLLGGCASLDYRPLEDTVAFVSEVTVDHPFGDVWTGLVDRIASASFTIDTIAKESGVMVVRFGAGDISRFVDCGTIEFSDGGKSAVAYMQRELEYQLSAFMTVLVQPVGPEQTLVRANANYHLEGFAMNGATITLSFATNERQEYADLVCAPTHEAERMILDGATKAVAGSLDK